MNIKGVNFPDQLLNALRDSDLVIFAGAGVSMGAPANLPDFPKLTHQISEGSGHAIDEQEPEDRFLNRLKTTGADVHKRAAELLQKHNPEPTELHRDLLKLVRRPEDVRIVTTNFDLLFEQSAKELGTSSRVFLAPALPYGRRFRGIVHVHGSVTEPEEMVLTSQDFGRAYLTESDGWARRFLVDLFARHIVLFVGYSHNDTIMTYLTPSLPRDDSDRRYALVGSRSDEPERWRNLGIYPIVFPQEDEDDYSGLFEAVSGLANYLRRGILDWQQKITSIASGPPPLDEESVGVIEHALADPVYTRFFIEKAKSLEWVDWLDNRNYLDALFSYGDLTEEKSLLAAWLGSFAAKEPKALFSLIERHGPRLNPALWNKITWQMGVGAERQADERTLSRWAHFLLSAAPSDFSKYILLEKMAENCASQGLLVNLLQIYDSMTESRGITNPRSFRRNSDLFDHHIQPLWEKCLKPNLPKIAESLLEKTAFRLEERHSLINAWEGKRLLDSDTLSRSAIEPHEQDKYPRGVDALIDIARDCLEWLAVNQPDMVKSWSERYNDSEAPLLRRLAIHALSWIDMPADEKISWLLEHCNLHDIVTHHEIFQAIGKAYPKAGFAVRETLIQAIQSFRRPNQEDEHKEGEEDYSRFTWLHWLLDADPDCSQAKQAVEAILIRYPEFLQREHPDLLMHWTTGTWTRASSPLSVEELLAKPAKELLTELLEYQPTVFLDSGSRVGLLTTVKEAAQENFDWGFNLAREMASMGRWDADLWPCLMSAWANAELDEDDIRQVLDCLDNDELCLNHTREMADAICSIAPKFTGSKISEFLSQANAIAMKLHSYAGTVDAPEITRYVGGVQEEVDWLTKAMNHLSGRLAQFWLHSIALWRKHQRALPAALSIEYQDVLATIMADHELPGKLARVIFTSQISFLTAVDEEWSKRNLIPLLERNHQEFESAWEGISYASQFNPTVAELLRDPFLETVKYIDDRMTPATKQRFITRYTSLLTWFVSGPSDQWITKLIAGTDQDVRQQFTREIVFHLRSLDEPAQLEWWNTWLRGYWENRLDGIPAPLDHKEIEMMLEWTNSLTAVYPEAVGLALNMLVVPMPPDHLLFGLTDSDIPSRYPCSLAKLLIRLGEADAEKFMWHGAKPIIDQLLQTPLDEETKTELKGIIAKFGL